ncbi:Uncharacterised protein [Mycobacteroides abscessus subsp. abscessus]|nr:Uncharacterised protein [Mycobacteroides abscessus subsp. abscessus]
MVATAAGGRAANASSVILGASSIPSQITSRKKYASGGKVLVPDSAGRRQLPDSDEHNHREQRKSGAGEPNAPLRRAWGGVRPRRFPGDDVDKYRHYAKDFL